MAAYLIVIAELKDRERFVSGYGKAAAELIGRFGGRYLLRGPGALALEGDIPDKASVVISEWEDEAAALRFWNSPEYAQVKTLREGLADVRVLLISEPKIQP